MYVVSAQPSIPCAASQRQMHLKTQVDIVRSHSDDHVQKVRNARPECERQCQRWKSGRARPSKLLKSYVGCEGLPEPGPRRAAAIVHHGMAANPEKPEHENRATSNCIRCSSCPGGAHASWLGDPAATEGSAHAAGAAYAGEKTRQTQTTGWVTRTSTRSSLARECTRSRY